MPLRATNGYSLLNETKFERPILTRSVRQIPRSTSSDPLQVNLERALKETEAGAPDAGNHWKVFFQTAGENEKLIRDLLSHITGQSNNSPIERLLMSQHWDALREAFLHLPDGTYAEGRVIKSKGSLVQSCHGVADGCGITMTASFTYVGQFKDGKREGRGRLEYVSGDGYDGEWREGRPFGLGTRFGADRPPGGLTGLYYDVHFLGDPRKHHLSFRERILSFL